MVIDTCTKEASGNKEGGGGNGRFEFVYRMFKQGVLREIRGGGKLGGVRY